MNSTTWGSGRTRPRLLTRRWAAHIRPNDEILEQELEAMASAIHSLQKEGNE